MGMIGDKGSPMKEIILAHEKEINESKVLETLNFNQILQQEFSEKGELLTNYIRRSHGRTNFLKHHGIVEWVRVLR